MIIRGSMLMVVVTTLVACNSNVAKDSPPETGAANSVMVDTSLENQVDPLTNTQNQYSTIARIFEKDDTTYIEADYIQYLIGDAAIEAARKANEVDTFRTKEGKIEFAVPNDYFILNENKKIRQLALSIDCKVDLLNNPDRDPPVADNSLMSLKEIHLESIFILTIDKNGLVVKIKEVFLP